MPISHPGSYAGQLAAATGPFYTQGMPEDTKAFKAGVFTAAEFEKQAQIAGDEVVRQYAYVLDRFRDGLLFYYFGNGDQVSHMMWRAMDPGHPAYKPADAAFADTVKKIYEQFDRIVGETLPRVEAGATLVVMSDHGFTSWRRAFHLNTWLRERGLPDRARPRPQGRPGALRERRLVAHPRVRPGAQRPLHQRGGAGEERHRGSRRSARPWRRRSAPSCCRRSTPRPVSAR